MTVRALRPVLRLAPALWLALAPALPAQAFTPAEADVELLTRIE
jgi:hypothetical protein